MTTIVINNHTYIIDNAEIADLFRNPLEKKDLEDIIMKGLKFRELSLFPTEKLDDISKEIKDLTVNNMKFSPCTKSSQALGVEGELEIEKRLTCMNIAWKDMSQTPHAGDLHITLSNGETVIIDVKNYSKNVQSDEVDKLQRDMNTQGVKYGLLYSLKSPISCKKTFDIDMSPDGKVLLCVHQVQDSCLKMAINVIELLSSYSKKYHFNYFGVQKFMKALHTMQALLERKRENRNDIVELNNYVGKKCNKIIDSMRDSDFELQKIMDDIMSETAIQSAITPLIDESIDNDEKNKALLRKVTTPLAMCIFDDMMKMNMILIAINDEQTKFTVGFSNENIGTIHVQKKKVIIQILYGCNIKFEIEQESQWVNSRQYIEQILLSVNK